MTSGQIEVAALGRPFTLGMLYDARKDQIIPGFTSWDEKSLQDNMLVADQNSSDFKITTSDSLEEKSSSSDVGVSSKASISGGSVEVGASANYSTDKKTSRNQSRVTFHYKATTTFKQLNISTDEKKAIKIDDDVKRLATHVVTGILYGANSFLVCDSERLDSSSLQKVEASIQTVVSVVVAQVKGEVNVKLSEEQKDVIKKFGCKFYGDSIPESNPATFEEAVKTYKDLPKLSGINKQNSVPLKVWMMPLKMLDQAAPEIISDVSTGSIRKAQDASEMFHQSKMRCNDCSDDSYNFLQSHERSSNFKKSCTIYAQKLQEMLANKLSLIRAGKEDESESSKVLDNRNKSPFSNQTLEKWIADMEEEVSIIRSCVEAMDGAKIAPKKFEVDAEVLDPDVEDVLCFVFTSSKTTDPYLQIMSDYSDTGDLSATKDVEIPSTENEWYLSNQTSSRAKAREFGDLARGSKKASKFKFSVTAIRNEKYDGATIYHYRNNKSVTEDFSKPDVPDVENVTNRRDLMWYATDLTSDPKSAHQELSLSEENKRATRGDPQSYPENPERFSHFPYVLCKEASTGHHYWEVEWSVGSGTGAGVGLIYDRFVRKGSTTSGQMGQNNMSWVFGQYWGAERKLAAYHHFTLAYSLSDPAPFNRLGVFLNWPSGTLSFYKVLSEKSSHIFTFRQKFSEPSYAVLNIEGKTGTAVLGLK